eukprot:2171267-Prymnesium_polylepis.1
MEGQHRGGATCNMAACRSPGRHHHSARRGTTPPRREKAHRQHTARRPSAGVHHSTRHRTLRQLAPAAARAPPVARRDRRQRASAFGAGGHDRGLPGSAWDPDGMSRTMDCSGRRRGPRAFGVGRPAPAHLGEESEGLEVLDDVGRLVGQDEH